MKYGTIYPSLKGRTVLVTGGGSGIGESIVEHFAAQGAKVGFLDIKEKESKALAARLKRKRQIVHFEPCDLTDIAALRKAIKSVRKSLGPITILVNNAGVPSGSFFTRTTDEEWRAVMSVNLDGVFRVGQEAARRMAANRTGGTIINIASLLGFGVIKGLSTYSATKAAVVSLTKSMALELARDRIRVNALAPGYFATEFNEAFLASDAGKRMMARVPMERAGAVEELDGPLLLLASDAGRFMTGSVVTVDGGHLLAMG
jgi:NAD(P)-dependent dehydrogenase (short-subunit alcohol dehydrogenase family)